MRAKLALLALVTMALVAGTGASDWSVSKISGQGTPDSLTAAVETLDTFTLPDQMDSAFVWWAADSIVVGHLEISTASGEWLQFTALDSNAADPAADLVSAVKKLPVITPEYSGKSFRLILDNRHSGIVFGNAWLSIAR